jgi:Spy/CpxP family protein refolding chaperone
MAVALLTAAAAFAQHGGPHAGGGHGRHGGHFGGPLGHFTRELNLTDAQSAHIKQLTDAFHESTKALHEQLSKGEGPLEGLQDGVFDEAAVRAAAQARAAAHVELEVAHAKLMAQVFAVLTPEQRAKLKELHQQHKGRRGQRPPTPAPGGEGF